MPVLSVYFGDKVISSIAVSDRGDVSKSHFEYSYSPYLYGHFYTEESFNSDLVKFFFKEHRLKKENTQVVVGSLLGTPKLNIKVAYAAGVLDLIKNVEDTFPIMANYHSIITKDECIYSHQKQQQTTFMSDLASNMDIYNFHDPSFHVSHSIARSQTLDLSQAVNFNSITIFGELLYNISNQEKSLMYKLLLDLISPVGIYKVFYDEEFLFVHKLLLSSFGLDMLQTASAEFCTLINVPGETACLIESEIGTSQLVTVPPEDIFILPLNTQSEVKVLLKNQAIGTREIKAAGGKLGLVVDTRNKTGASFDADVLNSAVIRKLEEALVTL